MNEAHLNINHREYLEKLGKRVAELRKQKGLTQDDLADRCGWEASNLRKIEGAHTNPTIKSLLTLCHGLEIEMTDLFQFE